jgi:hypothetical protein
MVEAYVFRRFFVLSDQLIEQDLATFTRSQGPIFREHRSALLLLPSYRRFQPMTGSIATFKRGTSTASKPKLAATL